MSGSGKKTDAERAVLRLVLEDAAEYERMKSLGHRPLCIEYRSLEPAIVDALVLGRALSAELREAKDYLDACPICAQNLGAAAEALRELGDDDDGGPGGGPARGGDAPTGKAPDQPRGLEAADRGPVRARPKPVSPRRIAFAAVAGAAVLLLLILVVLFGGPSATRPPGNAGGVVGAGDAGAGDAAVTEPVGLDRSSGIRQLAYFQGRRQYRVTAYLSPRESAARRIDFTVRIPARHVERRQSYRLEVNGASVATVQLATRCTPPAGREVCLPARPGRAAQQRWRLVAGETEIRAVLRWTTAAGRPGERRFRLPAGRISRLVLQFDGHANYAPLAFRLTGVSPARPTPRVDVRALLLRSGDLAFLKRTLHKLEEEFDRLRGVVTRMGELPANDPRLEQLCPGSKQVLRRLMGPLPLLHTRLRRKQKAMSPADDQLALGEVMKTVTRLVAGTAAVELLLARRCPKRR